MSTARRVIEVALEWSGIPRLAARAQRGRTLILAYHNVVPDDGPPAGDRSLHIPQSVFAAHLDAVAAMCAVVPLAAIGGPADPTRPRVAITFDDAYRGALMLGMQELQRRQLPATVFVPPGLLGHASFWWDACAGPDGLSPERRDEALGRLRGEDAAVRQAWPLTNPIPTTLRPGTADELRTALALHAGLTLGAHTWSHPNLTRLSPPELAAELQKPLAWLRDGWPADRVIPWLTYPYGLENAAVRAVARDAGYSGGLKVDGGWLDAAPTDPFALPRLNVPAGLSVRGLRLRLSGLLRTGGAPVQQLPA
jgi:peptidoglycan/xylan/chitin deacetylase (PgdA/CDA1 family)